MATVGWPPGQPWLEAEMVSSALVSKSGTVCGCNLEQVTFHDGLTCITSMP